MKEIENMASSVCPLAFKIADSRRHVHRCIFDGRGTPEMADNNAPFSGWLSRGVDE